MRLAVESHLMGKGRKPFKPAGQCIYCGRNDRLSKEHVIPLGMGGTLVLPKASCPRCADITRAFEERLLRGHWWPYRRKLGIRSRHPKEQPNTFPVTFEYPSGRVVKKEIPPDKYPFLMVCDFDPPSFLAGKFVTGSPVARVVFKPLIAWNDMPHMRGGGSGGAPKLIVDVDFHVEDFVRLLAKVALAYAVGTNSLAAFSEIFVNSIVVGSTDGALTYVGRAAATDSSAGGCCHLLWEGRYGDLLTVYIVFFSGEGEEMPVYQVVVGRLTQKPFPEGAPHGALGLVRDEE